MRQREGIEPRDENIIVDADAVSSAEGNTKEANCHGFGGPTGVKDSGTLLRQSRELGRSH